MNQTPSARLQLESLDERAVPAGLFHGSPFGNIGQNTATIVYTETNNPEEGENAVLAYRRDAVTGRLRQIGSFDTGGTGQLNVPKLVGPDDGDQQVQATADGKYLYAVNQGSDNITAFRIRSNGSLQRIGIFESGGDQPDSIGIAGRFLYVANRGDVANGQTATTTPGVRAFVINRDGSLTPISEVMVDFAVGTLATQTLISPDKRFLFVEVGTLSGAEGGNTVNTFRINRDGTLTAAPGGPAGAGADAPFLLGAAPHPRLNIVYTGFASSSEVGVFTYDETGRTTFVGAVPDSGSAPCWCVVSEDGRFLYVANTTSNDISVFSLADPLQPEEIQTFSLAGPQGEPGSGETNVFEIVLDPTGRFLYAVTQSTDPAFPEGNQLHTLRVARNGTLSEPVGPIIFSTTDVPANAHPQGVEVVELDGPSGFRWGHFAPIDVDWFHHGPGKPFGRR